MKVFSALMIAIPVSLVIGSCTTSYIEDRNMSYAHDYDKSVIQSSIRTCERINKKRCHFTSRYDYNVNALVWEVVPKP